jgi:GDPmannose 4,6-dehydratase
VETLLGDPGRAKEKLGWEPRITFAELVEEMMSHDLDQARRFKLLRDAGHDVALINE